MNEKPFSTISISFDVFICFIWLGVLPLLAAVGKGHCVGPIKH